MGKKRSRRRLSSGPSTVTVTAYVDVDYSRGSWANGSRIVNTSAPETWRVERVGILFEKRHESTGDSPGELRSVLLEGPTVVADTLRLLERTDCIVGHGLLCNDYRAFHMVQPVSQAIIDRTVDTLYSCWLARKELLGSDYPTGLSLTDLVGLNLGIARSKPRLPQRRENHLNRPYAGQVRSGDPRDDAALAGDLWRTLLREEVVVYGAGAYGWNSEVTWKGSDAGIAPIGGDALQALAGPGELHRRWHDQLGRRGSWIDSVGTGDDAAAQLFRAASDMHDIDLAASDLAEVGRILVEDGLLSPEDCCHREQLTAAFSFLGSKQHLDARHRIISGKRFTKVLAAAYGWALWRSSRLEDMHAIIGDIMAGRNGTAHSWMRADAARARQADYKWAVTSAVDAGWKKRRER